MFVYIYVYVVYIWYSCDYELYWVYIGCIYRVCIGCIQLYKLKYNINLIWYRFKSTLNEDFLTADLIISHAGAGTVIEVLKMKNKKLIICVNDTLQENHQIELADILKIHNYCDSTTPNNLIDVLESSKFVYEDYPEPDLDAFPGLLDTLI